MIILRFLAATAAIVGTQLVLATAFVGIGLLFRRGFGVRRIEWDDLFSSFWIGFSLVLLLLQLWSFRFPVGIAALVLVLGLGTLGLLGARRHDWAVDRRSALPCLLILLPISVWMAGIAMESVQNWDAGLYHVQAIKWIESYPAVPGLVNLFGPLAFNNSSFLYDALLDSGPWEDRAYHVANGLLVLALAAQAVSGAVHLLRRGNRGRPRHVFDLLLLGPAVAMVRVETIASYVTDVSTVLVLLAALSAWYALLTDPGKEGRERAYAAVVVGALLAAAVCLKLSTALFVAIAWPLAVVSWLATARPNRRLAVRTLAWATALGIALVGSWMGRGIVTSGYPLFPHRLAAAPVEWRAPAEHADAERAY
ncbi:MAG: LIC_10190 family membrane protein, partial [Gemmatimonadota bacterium]